MRAPQARSASAVYQKSRDYADAHMQHVTGADTCSPSQSRGAASFYTGHLGRPTTSSYINCCFLGPGLVILTGERTGPEMAKKQDFGRISLDFLLEGALLFIFPA